MALPTQPYKGARDFYPEDKRLQNYIFDAWRKVAQRFGYEEYDAPILEPLDLYRAKTGEEIVNEQLYSFIDRGDREVAIRPEMTPTVSRMVAGRRQELGYPLRWYSIPNLWRYERPQRGRLREHWQLNVDIFGDESLNAEIEMIQLADAIMKEFGAKPEMYEIRINSRLLLEKRIKNSGIKSAEHIPEAIRILDAYEKMGREETKAKLAAYVNDPEDLLRSLEEDGPSEEVKELAARCRQTGLEVNTVETLARGFDYYTDIVFEVFDTNSENNRSLFGGGRYDGLVGLFGVEPVPTVGFGMGDVTLANFLETHGLTPSLEPCTDVAVLLIGDVYEQSQPILKQLRNDGLNVSVDSTNRKIDRKIKSADKQGVKFVVFIGEQELKSKQFSLKNLSTGEEQEQSLEQITAAIKSSRR